MKIFLGKIAVFCAIQAVLGVVICMHGTLIEDDDYTWSICDKRELLRDKSHPRIIFVGGSNVAFGIDSGCFHKHLDLRPVNLGHMVGLGLDLPLKMVANELRPGDLVMIMPEYELLTTNLFDGGAALIESLVEYWPEAGEFLGHESPDSSIKELLGREGLQQFHEVVRLGLKRIPHTLKRRQKKRVYSRNNFNEYGDMVGHHGKQSKEIKGTQPITRCSRRRLKNAIRRLNEFDQMCQAAGARCFFSYPPIPEDRFRASRKIIRRIEAKLAKQLDMPILHRPNDIVFPMEFFYDTTYHLGQEGARQRSEIVAASLRKWFDSGQRRKVAVRSKTDELVME